MDLFDELLISAFLEFDNAFHVFSLRLAEVALAVFAVSSDEVVYVVVVRERRDAVEALRVSLDHVHDGLEVSLEVFDALVVSVIYRAAELLPSLNALSVVVLAPAVVSLRIVCANVLASANDDVLLAVDVDAELVSPEERLFEALRVLLASDSDLVVEVVFEVMWGVLNL